jgi:hypothetical protein
VREEALAVWEEMARISKMALVKVSADLHAKRVKTEATHQEYLDKMHTHTARAKPTLGLDKMLEEKKVLLIGKEWDLALCEAALMEVQSLGPILRDNHEELMEFIKLRRCLEEAEVEHITKVGQLAVLLGDISNVLVDLGMPPISGIPQDPGMAGDVSVL